MDDATTERLEGFEHLYFGSGSDGLRWIYGEASTPEQFALRTGTATFRGGLLGYYAHGSIDSNTVYEDSVFGSLTLNIDFGSNLLTGEGSLEIDNAARSENLSFTLNEAAITQTNDGLTRSLRFSSGAELLDGVSGNGNFSGAFYGADASEAAGSFAFGLVGGFAAGVWAAGENYEPTEHWDYPVIVSYSNLNGGITDRVDRGIGKIPELGDNLTLTIDGTATTVTSASNVQAGDYNYTSMGQWTGGAPSSPINTGYWVAGEATPTSGLDVRTGSATFAGNIIGDFVSHAETRGESGTREDATGTIRLTADFTRDQIDGEMQFVSADTATEIIDLTSPISDSGYFFESNGFDFDRPVYGYGFSGTFFGPTATEAGGSVWAVTEAGTYNGVFRAGEGLSFGEFVTPTGVDVGIDYSNYRGLYAFSGRELVTGDYVEHFASVTDISNEGRISISGTNGTPNISDAISGNMGASDQFDYVSWGQWSVAESGNLTISANGQDTTFASGSWLVYDPTTDLPTSGSATYNGFVNGRIAGGDELRGDISLTADFAADRVTGDMGINAIGAGADRAWANASFDTSITRDTNSSGFQGALTGTDVNSGAIFGGFAGPNAEEVGGGWQIDHMDGSSANGIFRASQ